MRKIFVCLGSGIIAAVSIGLMSSVEAAGFQQDRPIPTNKISIDIYGADQSALVKKNRDLLLANRSLARKIASKLGIQSAGDVPTSGTPLEQNLVLILQNQETFKAIATKVGASVPDLGSVDGSDQAEKNHKTLLQNKSIVVGILKKLGIAPAGAELKGTFVEKNHTLLVGNGKALAKIADKLGVK
jgi:hypothetical protein